MCQNSLGDPIWKKEEDGRRVEQCQKLYSVSLGECLEEDSLRQFTELGHSGYILTEVSLFRANFSVSAACSFGFAGIATTAVCSGDDREYDLKGCVEMLSRS